MTKRTKYDFERLDNYCTENNVILLDDYSEVDLNQNVYIESKCYYNNCDNIVIKTFKNLEKYGSYCINCIKLKACEVRKKTCLEKYGVENITYTKQYTNKSVPKYNYTLLRKYCDDNMISLLNNYENIRLHSHYYIEGKCQNSNCQNNFKKHLYKLINTNGMCKPCIFEKAKAVRKETNLKNIGCENYFQNTNIKQKIQLTNKIKYGVEYASQNQEIKNKCKQTYLKNYGVEHISYLKETQDKIKKTNFKKYGVNHLMQNPDYLDEILKKSFKFKNYILPSGNIIKIQGYEHYALDELIINNKIDELNIITGTKNVPLITYIDNNNVVRHHYGDIFIPKENKIIEVKSTWTFKKPHVLLKQQAAIEKGYKYEIWVYDKKGNKTCY
jgi:hypothetical protein